MPWAVTMPPALVVDEDARLAREVLRGYASLRGETDVIRCKLTLCSFLPICFGRVG